MNSKKKILFLMEYPIDLPGGGQMSTWTLCDGILAEGFEPVVVCPTLLSTKKSDFNFKICEYSSDENRERSRLSRIKNFVSRIFSFYRLIKKEKPDLIHVSMSESLITFGFLRCLSVFSDIPFVYTDRGLAYGYRGHSRLCIKKTMKHASGMICTTQFNKDLWLKEAISTPITVIPNTINKIFAIYDPAKRDIMRDKNGIDKNELVIGFAGRISEEKDWDLVPVLTKALHDAGIRFKVALVISTYEEQDEEIAASVYNGIAASIGSENVIYYKNLSQKEIADYYYMVDVFVMSSMFESFGKAAVEAMSRRCSVVSTNVGGLPEVIGKEENLYSKDNIERFVVRIDELSKNREELEGDREFFYNRYRNRYTTEVHIMRHVNLYNSIIDSTK